MKVAIEGREMTAEVSIYRCREFVSATFFVNGQEVTLSDTRLDRYKLVEASPLEREVLKGWGYRIEGL